jgi:hypothetical protein
MISLISPGPPNHAFGADDAPLITFPFPFPFSEWVISAERYWVTLAKRPSRPLAAEPRWSYRDRHCSSPGTRRRTRTLRAAWNTDRVNRSLIAACTRDREETIGSLTAAGPQLKSEVIKRGGTLLAQFARVGNLAGVRNLLALGVSPAALNREGDGHFGVAKDSTALHVAAWRAWPEVVKELIARGAPVNATDAQSRTALQLAVKACVDSYWTDRRSPDSVRALLEAGAFTAGIELPTGYDEVDKLLEERLI